jgi:hypothetical protein
MELSIDLPVVYEMRTDLSSTSGVASDTTVAPATASLGDLRMGLRYAIPLQSRDGELNVATALDVWTPSNYVDVPVGLPESRARVAFILSGALPLPIVDLDYSISTGLEAYLADVPNIGLAPGLPVRVAAGVPFLFCANRLAFRPTVEYFGMVPFTDVGGYPRQLSELLVGFALNGNANRVRDERQVGWSVGPSFGKGLTDAPGSPSWQLVFAASLTAPTR